MDEYQIEIQDTRRTLSRLKADRAPDHIVEEYEAELRNLRALYEAANQTLAEGREDARLPRALAGLGFGDWTLANVYAFVYEAAMDAELEGKDLANVITHTDFAASLRAVLDDG